MRCCRLRRNCLVISGVSGNDWFRRLVSTARAKLSTAFQASTCMRSSGGLNLLDETGLPGIYSWARDQQRAEAGMTYKDVVQDAFRNMITSAGLKLETRKVLQDTIVVDHLEKVPTEN